MNELLNERMNECKDYFLKYSLILSFDLEANFDKTIINQQIIRLKY